MFRYPRSDVRRIPSAIVLAAGGSTRMGTPKALLRLGGTPLVALHCAALAHAARRIVVVVGAHANEVRAAVPARVAIVENRDWTTTFPVDSVRCAVVQAALRGALLVTPVDVPPARPDTLDRLVAAGGPAVPIDPLGRRGHPVVLDAAKIAWLRRRSAPSPLDVWLADATTVPVSDRDVAIDFDDPAAWERFLLDG
jgi:CTP:molybdopterin cytidylyltransferase MocA